MRRPGRLMAFRLAKDLGIWNVDDLMRQMPAKLQDEWNTFYRLERKALEDARTEDRVAARTEEMMRA